MEDLPRPSVPHEFAAEKPPAAQSACGESALADRATGSREYCMLKATQLRPGMVIVHQGDLYTVHSVDHRTPGNKRGAMATRMRNMRSGSIIDYRFRAEDFVERAVLDEIEYQYLYSDPEGFHFMNTETYDQIHLPADVLGDAVNYLIPNLTLKLEYYEGKPIGAVLPDTVDLTVVDTEPTVQKATASAVTKAAKLETGLTIMVPPFINNGDKVKVDTTEARYIQRAQ
jgi:elongation factor P